MSDYTPTTEEVRCMYMLCASYPAKALPDRNLIPSKIALKQFDRWLAAHDREIAARALDDFAETALEKFVKQIREGS